MPQTFDFSEALERLKEGRKVQRIGWNGKGIYLYHVPAGIFEAMTNAARSEFGDTVPYGAYIAVRTAQGYVVPWSGNVNDILAEDWVEVA